MRRMHIGALAAALATFGATTANASCGSAFCFVNTNWSLQGVWTQPGPHVDLRFEYIDQDQPMARQQARSRSGEIPAHHDEVSTINRNFITTLDYGFNAELGHRRPSCPSSSRDHEHIHNHGGETAARDNGTSRRWATCGSRAATRR